MRTLFRLAPSLTIAACTLGAVVSAPSPAQADVIVKDERMLPFEPEHLVVSGLDVIYYFPRNRLPRDLTGVIYFFHGGGGNAETWIRRTESASMVADAVSRGFGIVSTESTGRLKDGSTGWRFYDPSVDPNGPTPGVNDDEMHIRNVHNVLSAQMRLFDPVRTPIFLAGASNGGRFVSAMSYRLKQPVAGQRPERLNVKATAIYIKGGSRFYLGLNQEDGTPFPQQVLYDTPTIFNHGINDPNNPDVIQIQQELEATLRQRVAAGLIDIRNTPFTTINTTRPTPLTPERLTRVPGVSYALSRLMYRDLEAAGAIDTRDLVRPGAIRVLESNSIFNLDTQQLSDVKAQLTLLQAGHAVNSNDNLETLRFFELHR